MNDKPTPPRAAAEWTADLESARAEAAKSAKLLREAVASIAQGFTIYDENDRLVICNEAYRRFYEDSRDLIVEGNSFEQIVRGGAERGQYIDAIGRIDDWVAKRVAQHQSADGKIIEQELSDGRWLLIVEHRTPSGFIAGNRIDITDLKRAEAALRKSEARANQIFESAPEAMLLVNADGRIERLNGRALEVFGYEQGELVGRSIELLVPAELREWHGIQRKGYAMRSQGRPMGQGRVLSALRRDGSRFPAEISLSSLDSVDDGTIVVSVIDNTERRRAQAALEDRNAKLDAIFMLSPDGLVSFDRDGLVSSANPAFLRMLGLQLSEVVGRPATDLERQLRDRAAIPEVWPGLAACFRGEKIIAGGKANNTVPRHLLSLCRPRAAILNLVGVVSDAPSVGRLLYVQDVTHEVEVDRIKSEFLAHAAHELRTPMASIFGFSELLLEMDIDDATRRDLLETIHRQTSWLVAIINELLDLARIESRRGQDFKIEVVTLAPLLADIVTTMRIDAGRWPLVMANVDEPMQAFADVSKLRQALSNVIGNAVKYSPTGGAIDIGFATRHDGRNKLVGVSIADHGVGMTPEQVARVGERFYRADTSGKIPGTGLGMAIATEIVQLLNGKIDVTSAPGVGTTVMVWLPRADDAGRKQPLTISN